MSEAVTTCDKGKRCAPVPERDTVRCETCGKVYARCERHGGAAGARRSLVSHMGLRHYQEPTR